MDLKEALKQKGLTYHELGRRIGRHEQTIAKYARGAKPIPPEVARLISFSTGIPIAEIGAWEGKVYHTAVGITLRRRNSD